MEHNTQQHGYVTPGTYKHLSGEAWNERDHKDRDLMIDGAIGTPADYIARHKDYLNDHSLVEVSYDERYVLYIENSIVPKSMANKTIYGKLKKSKHIKELAISFGGSSAARFSPLDLRDHLKRYLFHVADKPQAQKIITQLSKLETKVQATLQQIKENDGQRAVNYYEVVEAELDRNFSFEVPIWHNGPKEKIEIEIIIQSAGHGNITLELQSLQLEELIDTQAKEIIDKEISLIEKIQKSHNALTIVYK